MKKALAMFVICLSLSSYSQKGALAQVEPQLKRDLSNYLLAHHSTPEEYVINKFRDHDLVFIGEMHRIKHDVELIQALIPRLYENGIYTLGLEFARREDQPLIDKLLEGSTYDEILARQIQFNMLVTWGFQEYVDIYKVAWQLNRSLPERSRKFRILGLFDSPDWSLVIHPEDRDDLTVKKKVWRGGGEHLWAKLILDEIVAKGEKALIYSGIHHAFTEYKQPIVDEREGSFIRFEETRMGNLVYRAVGKRAITIYLHGLWPSAKGYDKPYVYPADGIIDAVMTDIDPQYVRVGFDTRGSPFGQLPGETSIYKHGYDKFSLKEFCDGYIYQKPLSESEGVTPIEDFVNAQNLEQARLHAPNPRFRTASLEEFKRAIAEDAATLERLIRRMTFPK